MRRINLPASKKRTSIQQAWMKILPYSQPPVIERMKAVLARAREGDSREKTVDKFQNYDFYVPSVAKYR